MRIEALDYFLEIARTQSFTCASRNLFISQQGLSKAIAALEREIGAPLFQRKGKRVELTNSGQAIFPYARDIVEGSARLRSAVAKDVAGRSRTSFTGLRIAASPFVCNSMFNLLEEEMEEFHLSNCAIREIDYPEIVEFACGEGLALCNFRVEDLPAVLGQEDVEFIPLFSIDLVVLASRALVSPNVKEITPPRLASLPLAYYNEQILNCVVSKAIGLANCDSRDPILHTSNYSKILSLVREGKAATFSDSFSSSIVKRSEGIISIPMNPKVNLAVGFLVGANVNKSGAEYAYIAQFDTMLKLRHGPYLRKNRVSMR